MFPYYAVKLCDRRDLLRDILAALSGAMDAVPLFNLGAQCEPLNDFNQLPPQHDYLSDPPDARWALTAGPSVVEIEIPNATTRFEEFDLLLRSLAENHEWVIYPSGGAVTFRHLTLVTRIPEIHRTVLDVVEAWERANEKVLIAACVVPDKFTDDVTCVLVDEITSGDDVWEKMRCEIEAPYLLHAHPLHLIRDGDPDSEPPVPLKTYKFAWNGEETGLYRIADRRVFQRICAYENSRSATWGWWFSGSGDAEGVASILDRERGWWDFSPLRAREDLLESTPWVYGIGIGKMDWHYSVYLNRDSRVLGSLVSASPQSDYAVKDGEPLLHEWDQTSVFRRIIDVC